MESVDIVLLVAWKIKHIFNATLVGYTFALLLVITPETVLLIFTYMFKYKRQETLDNISVTIVLFLGF